jgi:hypothetical protein
MTDKGMVVLQNCLDSQRDVPGSHSEICASSSHDGDQAVNIKVEEFSEMEDWEDPVPMTVVEVKIEPEVSCMSVCPLLGISHSHPEFPVLFLLCFCHKKLLQSGEGPKSFLTCPKRIASCCTLLVVYCCYSI